MKTFVVLSAFLAVALCRPDGYNYPVPHTSYGVPAYSSGIVSSSSNIQPAVHSSPVQFEIKKSIPIHQSSYVSTGDNLNTNTGFKSASEYSTGYTSGYTSSAPQSGSSFSYGSFDNSNAASHHVSTGLNLGSSEYQTSYVQSGINSLAQQPSLYQTSGASFQTVQKTTNPVYVKLDQQAPAQVYKHFYVHTAPEEPEAPRQRAIPVVPPPQKHYKVIFIKTPNQAPANPPVIHYPPQVEEKTLVYVLSKKAEEQQDVVIPKVEPKAPAKPEVFYIKYDKEGGEHVINNIVSNLKGNDVQTTVVNQEELSAGTASSGASYTVSGSEQSLPSTSHQIQSLESTHVADESQVQLQGLPHKTYGVPFRA